MEKHKHALSSSPFKVAKAEMPAPCPRSALGQLFDLKSPDMSGPPLSHQQESDSWLT